MKNIHVFLKLEIYKIYVNYCMPVLIRQMQSVVRHSLRHARMHELQANENLWKLFRQIRHPVDAEDCCSNFFEESNKLLLLAPT
jgi:hypothetical protein